MGMQKFAEGTASEKVPELPADVYIHANVILQHLTVQPKGHQGDNAAQIMPRLLLHRAVVQGHDTTSPHFEKNGAILVPRKPIFPAITGYIQGHDCLFADKKKTVPLRSTVFIRQIASGGVIQQCAFGGEAGAVAGAVP